MARKKDAISLLTQDHREVEALFDRFESGSGAKTRLKIAQDICASLRLHARAEEEIFYPAAREAIDESDLVDEAEVEHDTAKYLMERIESGELDEDGLRAHVMVLKEYVAHHVEEEEQELFKQVRDTDLDLAALGEEIEALKSEAA
jgi:hemerythrin superfamily protein